jgi:peptide/nickel transport system substrate-binding protein
MTEVEPRRDRASLDGLVRMLRDRRITRRGFLARAAGLLGSLAAAEGLLARVAGAQTTTKTELVIAQSGDISKLDPHLSTGGSDVTVTFNLYDHVTSRHRDNKLHPSLATEWKAVGPTTWQFKLRPGVKFHNGDPFTSADVKFSIERTYDPKARTSVATIFTTVDRVEAPDPLSVAFHTKKPDPLLPARLAFFGGQIMPKRYFEAVGPEQFNARPVGSGPVRYVSWAKDDRLVLEAFADYWGGKPDYQRVIFRPIPEVGPRIAALMAGEVDIIFRIPPDHVDRIARHPTTKVEEALFAGLYTLTVNSRRPPLDNPKVKQALSLAIDREAIVKELWRGRGIIPNGPIAKGDHHSDDSLPPLKYDPALAKQRLREAGYKGEEIIIESTVGYLINDKAMSETVVSMWRDVGINGKIELIEASVRAQKIRERSFKGMYWGEPASTLGDPDGMMWRLLGPGGINDYWRHPRFDELGNAARFSLDEKFRGEAYREMTRIFLEHLPWIPILQPIESYGLQKYVEWKPYPNQQIELRAFNFRFRRA